MLAKLALRNVRRQMSNYFVYFMTVILTVALLFALCNMIFSPQLNLDAESNSGMKNGLMGLIAFVFVIVTFVLGYAASFLLKFRKQEFGMYLTLGMTRNNILLIFLTETLIMGIVALGTGILLGLFFYQGMVAIMMKLMQLELTFASYSAKGLLVTIGLVIAIFLLSAFTSFVYLEVVNIYDLLHGAQKSEKKSRHPKVWVFIMAASLLIMTEAAMDFIRLIEIQYSSSKGNLDTKIMLDLLIMAIALIFLHIGVAKSLIPFLFKKKTFCGRGTNTFTLRQLSGTLSVNSVMVGLMAFLLTAAIFISNGAFFLKILERTGHERSNPFDVTYVENNDTDRKTDQAILPEQAEPIIDNYAKIEKRCTYTTYRDETNELAEPLDTWYEKNVLYVCTNISQSDFNALCRALGYPTVNLDGRFLVVTNSTLAAETDYSSVTLHFGSKDYPYGGKREGQSPLPDSIYTVVPDEAVESLEGQEKKVVYVLEQKQYDAEGLQEDLTYHYTYTDEYGENTNDTCDYWLKEMDRQVRDSEIAIFIIGALYIGIVFLLMVMAILALKIMSGLTEDKRRYRMLSCLGVSEGEQRQTLLRQTASFFFQPLILPVLSSVPMGWLFGRLLQLHGCAGQVGEMYLTTFLIALVTTILYLLYFIAIYQIAKRTVVQKTKC
ncbi:FtsX-like permease family protein [Emergencia timonensis]|uniref:FtsX-like permease family protein n=1 Tax=Emergencia timonensis TaxID=1776384 RepID=UPI00399586E2